MLFRAVSTELELATFVAGKVCSGCCFPSSLGAIRSDKRFFFGVLSIFRPEGFAIDVYLSVIRDRAD
jgi:hypothetical protein